MPNKIIKITILCGYFFSYLIYYNMEYFIADSHNDFLTVLNNISIKKYLKDNKSIFISSAIFTSEMDNPLQKIKQAKSVLKFYKNTILSIEDSWFVNKANIHELLSQNPFSCTLTWNYKNKLCGGSSDVSGLTKWGKEYVKILYQNNVIIDNAHLSHKGMNDVFNLIDQPVYNSHANIYSLCNHNRNLFDHELKNIYLTNGFLGLNLVNYFLSKNHATIYDLVNHIDYFVQKYSINNIGFGTDFYGSKNLILDNYKDFFVIVDLLKSRGYTKNDIEKIFCKNYLCFLQRCGRKYEKNDS